MEAFRLRGVADAPKPLWRRRGKKPRQLISKMRIASAESLCRAEATVGVGEKSKDAQALLAEWYDDYAGAVYRLLLAILGKESDAQDALSEVFLNLARRDLRPIKEPRFYLLAAARNIARSLLRKQKRENLAAACDHFFTSDSLSPEKLLLAQQVETALLELPAEQREVVVLKVYEELSFGEIARLTHTRLNTVASRYRYAAEKLRRLLEEVP
jgi:RNA polymerase sigma-70 factor, ECF subfamily